MEVFLLNTLLIIFGILIPLVLIKSIIEHIITMKAISSYHKINMETIKFWLNYYDRTGINYYQEQNKND